MCWGERKGRDIVIAIATVIAIAITAIAIAIAIGVAVILMVVVLMIMTGEPPPQKFFFQSVEALQGGGSLQNSSHPLSQSFARSPLPHLPVPCTCPVLKIPFKPS